jgi:two-component system, NarL family, nitrate/nitrite response regulator NarL
MTKRILIADDSDAARSVIRFSLETLTSYEVCGEAVNGAEAIEKSKKLKPDLILLDLSMPGMSGLDTASILKRAMPDTPIVLFTMYSDAFEQELKFAVGVDAVLSKPSGVGNLVKCLEGLLEAA